MAVPLLAKNNSIASSAPYAVIVKMAKKLGIKEVQLNTPLRECSEKPLSKPEMDTIKKYFKGMSVNYVYWAKRKEVKAMDKESAEKRHGRDKK